jgi:hypothetical protein
MTVYATVNTMKRQTPLRYIEAQNRRRQSAESVYEASARLQFSMPMRLLNLFSPFGDHAQQSAEDQQQSAAGKREDSTLPRS